ncbi:MAG: hypothetical protein WC917_00025 [Bacilli bacterium]
MKKNKPLTKKEKAKRITAIKTIKKVLNIYKTHFKYLSEQKSGIPLKGISTKALHTILGTKVKQKPKECNHCHIKTNNGKSLCTDCARIPVCPSCTIMLGYWNDDKTELIYDAYNKPSLLNPSICQGCYDSHEKNPNKERKIRSDYGIARKEEEND